MRQLGTACVIAVGGVVLLGGVCAFVYGLAHPAPTRVVGLGPLDGFWAAEDYCFLGGVLAALGCGLTTFGVLVRSRPESDRVGRAWEPDEVAYSARDPEPTDLEAVRRA